METDIKKVLCVACAAVLLLSGCSVPKPEPTTPQVTINDRYGVYEFTFTAERVSHDRVGKDWRISYFINGETVKNGHRVLLPLGECACQTIEVEVREEDKQDDVGTGVLMVAICDGGFEKTTVTVTENGGRYKGSQAVWEITCTVKWMDKS